MDFFAENMLAIQKSNPELYLNLKRYEENARRQYHAKPRLQLVETKNGAKTVKVSVQENCLEKEFFLHSRYNPQIEAEKFAQEKMQDQRKHNLLFGFGLGYHVLALNRRLASENELTIMDTNVDVFLEALKHLDFQEVFNRENVDFCISGDLGVHLKCLSSFLDFKTELNIITHVPSISAITSELEDFKMVLMELNLRKSVSSSYGVLLEENFLANAKLIKQNVGTFFGKFRGLPIIIVCAGPSLDKNKNLLEGLKGKALVICVGHALKSLLKIGVRPDFIITIDPNEIVYKQIEGLENLDIPFILLATAASINARKYQGPKLIACQGAGYLRPGEEGYLVDTGGSVSTTALDIAIRLGGSPIIYLGQDLSFPQNKHHCEDSFHANTDVTFLKNMRTVKGADGTVLPTTLGMLSFKRWIENRISSEQGITFINATEGGVRLEGFAHLPFADVIPQYLNQSYAIEEIIKATILP